MRYSAAAALVGVLLIGGGAFWYTQTDKESATNTPPATVSTRAEASVLPAADSNTHTGLPVDSSVVASDLPVPIPAQTQPASEHTVSTEYPASKASRSPRHDTPGVAYPQEELSESLTLEESLNKIADGKIARSERKALRNKVLAMFANASVPVYDNASGIETHYSAEGLLDRLLISSYQVRVREIERDAEERITSLFIQTIDKP